MPRAILIATICLTAAACDPAMLMPSSADAGNGSKGGAAGAPSGRAGSGGPMPVAGIALLTDADGRLEPNAAGAVGAWWSAGDAFAPYSNTGPGSCQAAGFPTTACSTLTTPTPETPFLSDPAGRMCTSGIAAQVLPGSDGQLAWSAIWGNIVGVSLATSDPGPTPVIGAYDAPAHGITGFAFDIDGVLPFGHLRVLVPTTENDHESAYWQGAVSDMSPYTGPGHYEVRWPDVAGPLYLGGAAPPFDPTSIESIAFHVVSRETEAVPYDFCIKNLVLLTN